MRRRRPRLQYVRLSQQPEDGERDPPATTATKLPTMALRGLALRLVGDSKKRYAVGPRLGKSSGYSNTHARKALTPSARALAKKEYSAPPTRSPKRSTSRLWKP